MQPLPREINTCVCLKGGFSRFLASIFKTVSKAAPLSISDYFLFNLGLHLGAFGFPLGGHFSKPENIKNISLALGSRRRICDPSGRRGELGGIWKAPGWLGWLGKLGWAWLAKNIEKQRVFYVFGWLNGPRRQKPSAFIVFEESPGETLDHWLSYQIRQNPCR